MKQTLVIVVLMIGFLSCKDKFIDEQSSVTSLKVFDFDVQRVKKIDKFYALIDTSEINFLTNESEEVFHFSYEHFRTNETVELKLTDVVAGDNNEIFIIGTEIRKDHTFLLYISKIGIDGQLIWNDPKIVPITDNFDYDEGTKLTKSYFFISNNGYALGCFYSGKLNLVVNYQMSINFKWYYKLIAIGNDGSVLLESEPMQESHPEIWNYMIEPLPNGNLLTSLAVGSDAFIHQFDANTFELKASAQVLATDIGARLPIFTNMLVVNNNEVIFTGHANRQNNDILGGNFDAIFVSYNTAENSITNTHFKGANSSYELTFHSFLDSGGEVRCIGTKREDLFISQGPNSSLFEASLNLNSQNLDSIVFFQDNGYEGLYFEPVENTGMLKVLGNKLDISEHRNKQAFFTIVKQ